MSIAQCVDRNLNGNPPNIAMQHIVTLLRLYIAILKVE